MRKAREAAAGKGTLQRTRPCPAKDEVDSHVVDSSEGSGIELVEP